MTISCIICSRNRDISARLRENISETINHDYEIVIIDNSKQQYSIFSAYNEGVRRAKGDILCFMHEDILFHSNNWGEEVCKRFTDASVGIIGVLGTQFLPDTPSAWWWTGCRVGYVLQSLNGDIGTNNTYVNGDPVNTDVDAVVVDGLWFCVRKELFDKISFDEVTFKSFHCYDHDICMQALQQGKRIIIDHNIVIEHASLGNVGKEFISQLHLFYDKWEKSFPIFRGIQIDEEGQEHMKNIVKLLYEKNIEIINLKASKKYRIGQFFSYLIHPLHYFKK